MGAGSLAIRDGRHVAGECQPRVLRGVWNRARVTQQLPNLHVHDLGADHLFADHLSPDPFTNRQPEHSLADLEGHQRQLPERLHALARKGNPVARAVRRQQRCAVCWQL